MTTLPASAGLTGSAPPLPASLASARAALAAATSDYLAIPDAVLERDWTWREGENPVDVRTGIYRAAESVEAAGAEIEALLAGAGARTRAELRIAPSTIARWALQGRLASLDDALLDRVPKEGEWSARQTLAHIIDGQQSYGWFTRWWVTQPVGEDRPSRVTEAAERQSEAELPGEEAEGAGSIEEIQARLDAVLDEWALRFATVGEEALALPARWSGVLVDVDFRLGRWASHIAEHAIQLDKTVAWLGTEPTEVARIIHALYATWGRLEARIWPAPTISPAVEDVLVRLSTVMVEEARSTRAAAEG
jgi:hypothetical protein